MEDGRLNSTIYDVSRLSGVSTATVSRAFSNPELVREGTRRKVYEAAEVLHYSPNAIARAMARQRLLRGALMVLCVLICMSTVFLKQHSIVDVALGTALGLGLDLLLRQRRPESWLLFRLLQPRKGRTALD